MIKQVLPFFIGAFFVASCGSEGSTAVEAEVGEAVADAPASSTATTYSVEPGASKVMWMGSKLVGDSHKGTIDVQEGDLEVTDDEIVGGEFTLDMNSLTNVDMAGTDGQGKLEGHLKGEDFFETGAFPTATFSIVSVAPISGTEGVTHEITGNLTMKGATKSVKVPAAVTMTADVIEAKTPPFTINRTDWNVKYGSGLTGAVGDKVINDEVELTIDLKAKKA